MATTTTNYGLVKPSYGDNADISVINSNMDKIDTKMKEIEDAGCGGASTWAEVANKPFETVGSGLSVDESGALNVTGGGSGGGYGRTVNVLLPFLKSGYRDTHQITVGNIADYDEFYVVYGNEPAYDINNAILVSSFTYSTIDNTNANSIAFSDWNERMCTYKFTGNTVQFISNSGEKEDVKPYIMYMEGIKYAQSGGSGGGSVNYSTEEQVIGTWINGKPLYRKTFEFSNISTGNSDFAHGISVDKVVNISGIGMALDTNFEQLNFHVNYGGDIWSYVFVTNTDISFRMTTRSFVKAYVTLEYTKSTD